MNIVIYNGELHSGMQMYLALSTQYNVQVANDAMDLMYILDSDTTDYTFLDICDENNNQTLTADIISQIIKKHPANKLIGLCREQDESILQKAARMGIKKVITKPIKNRELFNAIDETH